MSNTTIRIDNEFNDLIPPLSDEEYSTLQDSIIKEGCREALILWNDIILDGHNRYKICQQHNIPFKTMQKDFDSRNDAVIWMIQNQLGRRNLPTYERARLALRLKPVIAEKAKEKELQRKTTFQKSEKSFLPTLNTAEVISKSAGVSHDTIAKVEKLEAEAPPEMKDQLRRGEISINQAYNSIKQKENPEKPSKKAEEEEQESKPHVAYNSGNNEWYTPSEYIEAARKVMGHIDLDPASSDIANEVVKAGTYYTAEDNGLTKLWFGNVWMNPPYSADLIGQFVDKLAADRKTYHQAIVLVNNATETKWFGTLVDISSAIVFPSSRVKFYMPDGKTGAPLQGQAIIYVGDSPDEFLCEFDKFGWGVKPWKK